MSKAEWLFDQAPNAAAITTRQVIDLNCPILQVTHYEDDHSWRSCAELLKKQTTTDWFTWKKR